MLLYKVYMKIELEGYGVTEKIVKTSGNSGRVYLPGEWVGKRVQIILLDPPERKRTEPGGI